MPIIFRSGTDIKTDRKLYNEVVAVDLGFAQAGNESCGFAKSQNGNVIERGCFSFGKCIDEVVKNVREHKKIVLIIEAPLSGLFGEEGNPMSRGDFEKNSSDKSTRYWYTGAGASVCLGALFFLRALNAQLQTRSDETSKYEIVVYEGFVTFKKRDKTLRATRTKCEGHIEDAELLVNCFNDKHDHDIVTVNAVNGYASLALADVIALTTSSPTPHIIVPE